MHHAEENFDVPLMQRLIDRGATFVATGGYSGYAGIVPGTVGSLVGLLLYLPATASPISWRIAAVVAGFFLGVYSSSRVAALWKIKDPHAIVIDEVVGMLMTLALLPLNGVGVLVGFLVFRVFDVVKPWPAARFEALHGGLGVMADDAMAGIYGNLVMRGLLLLAPSWFS